MASLNKVVLIGNIGRAPETKVTTGGQPVCRFSLATTESWKNQAGEKQSKTEWHNIVVWGKSAETADRYLTKGAQVCIEGRIQSREYTTQDGTKKVAHEIRCDNFVMLGKREEAEEKGSDFARDYAANAGPAATDQFEDDIPF